MDTRTAKADVTPLINEIKAHMPETYKSIQSRAVEAGNVAYEYVRRGLRGEPNCFYAFERGRVMGTPFSIPDIPREAAYWMVTFGCAHVCIWAEAVTGTGGAQCQN